MSAAYGTANDARHRLVTVPAQTLLTKLKILNLQEKRKKKRI
jgi:hypothetical protein